METNNQNETQMSFQQAMNRLQEIVMQLNNQNLDLEKAMAYFEEGLRLSRYCEGQLNHFEQQMNELLEENSQPQNPAS